MPTRPASVPEPSLSVIVGSNGAPGALEECLAALEPQRDGAEVPVCEPDESSPELQGRFPWARFVHRAGALVPVLWSEGIKGSDGDIVALTISPMRPAPDWIETIRAEHRRHDAVGGAIDPGAGLHTCDWAEYFCRYAREMLPFEAHECQDLPGDNAAYKRELLERASDSYKDGFWEPDVHRELARDGALLWHSPDLVVRQGRSAGTRAFVRQRLKHGRAYGHQRGVHVGAARNLAGVLGAPLVPAVMGARIFRQLKQRRRYRLRALLVLPHILLFNVAWAVGEGRGHLETLLGRPLPVEA